MAASNLGNAIAIDPALVQPGGVAFLLLNK